MLGAWLAQRICHLSPPKTKVAINLAMGGLEGTVIERKNGSSCDPNCHSKALLNAKKITFGWKKALKPVSPRSKTRIPVFASLKDPRIIFREEPYLSKHLKSLFADASLPDKFYVIGNI